VENIQIYLHAKLYIFLRYPSISPIFYSPEDLFNWRKNLKWKNHHGPFSARRPSSTPTPRPLPHAKPARYHVCASVSDSRDSPVSSLLTQFPSSAPPVWQHRPNYCRRASHPSPPRTTRIVVSSPATLSHRVGCGALWWPIIVARLRLPSSMLHRSDSRADRSAMKSSSSLLHWPSCSSRKHAMQATI
jgi:hypothetical protein